MEMKQSWWWKYLGVKVRRSFLLVLSLGSSFFFKKKKTMNNNEKNAILLGKYKSSDMLLKRKLCGRKAQDGRVCVCETLKALFEMSVQERKDRSEEKKRGGGTDDDDFY